MPKERVLAEELYPEGLAGVVLFDRQPLNFYARMEEITQGNLSNVLDYLVAPLEK